jgi:hypothetical protein
MRASLLYRIAAVLLLLFATGHTLGFRKIDAKWGIDSVVSSMKTVSFEVNGFPRTYWSFYVGFGLFVTVQLLFAAAACWQLGLEPPVLRSMPGLCWSLVLSFLVVSYLSWRYFFLGPLIFSLLITVLLALAAWRATRTA